MSEFQAEIEALRTAGRLRPFPRNPRYEVCDDGRILNQKGTAWLKPCPIAHGYLAVSLWSGGRSCGKLWRVHKIVILTFRGDPPSPKHEGAHDDGDVSNNLLENLLWKTKAENEADKIRHGRANRGERNGRAKLTDAQAADIGLRLIGSTRGVVAQIAREFGVHRTSIERIQRRERKTAHVI